MIEKLCEGSLETCIGYAREGSRQHDLSQETSFSGTLQSEDPYSIHYCVSFICLTIE